MLWGYWYWYACNYAYIEPVCGTVFTSGWWPRGVGPRTLDPLDLGLLFLRLMVPNLMPPCWFCVVPIEQLWIRSPGRDFERKVPSSCMGNRGRGIRNFYHALHGPCIHPSIHVKLTQCTQTCISCILKPCCRLWLTCTAGMTNTCTCMCHRPPHVAMRCNDFNQHCL